MVSPEHQQCEHGADNYGGQKWRDLTRVAEGETAGPKIYLGYYDVAPYRSWENPNRDTKIIDNLLSEMVSNYSHNDMNYDGWIHAWLEANLTVDGNDPANPDDSHPAAAIDARNPDDMVYKAVVWIDYEYPAPDRWETIEVYPDLDTAQ